MSECSRMRRQTSNPVPPGSMTSSTTAATSHVPSTSIALAASPADTTPKPSTARKSASSATMSGSSSTSSTVGTPQVSRQPASPGRIFFGSSWFVPRPVTPVRWIGGMKRFLTVIAATAVAAAVAAAITLPAGASDEPTTTKDAKFVACLRDQGLAIPPETTGDAIKTWLLAHDGVDDAIKACKTREDGRNVKVDELIACLRAH